VVYLDTSGLTIRQVYDKLIEEIKNTKDRGINHGAVGSGIGH
jgi:hypothetical protein